MSSTSHHQGQAYFQLCSQKHQTQLRNWVSIFHSLININIPKDLQQGLVNNQPQNWGFNFEKVFTNVSQQIIYDLTAKNILAYALEGYSGAILCYGQTGAGKTFTMTGPSNDYKNRGITPRTISQLFQQIDSMYEHEIGIGISYLQLYNDTMIDLLQPAYQPQILQGLSIQEDSKGYIIVKGQKIVRVKNQEQTLAVLFEGQSNRTTSEHKFNKNSSRSHCIFTIHLQMRSKVESSEKVIMSKFNLVDLAGSQRTKKTGSQGKILIEAQFINKSLSFLEQVVIALSQKNRDHIPYRQNKLTYLLKDCIGGTSRTIMIANIWPQEIHLQQTISTLKFAARMTNVTNEAHIQMNLDPQILIKKYQKQIKDLKQQLAMHDTLVNRGRITYDPYSSQQQYAQQKIAKEFLEGKIDDIDIQSLRQVKELFFQFKNLYKNLAKDIVNNTIKIEGEQKVQNQTKKKDVIKSPVEKVGVEENKFGFGVGKANKDAKPVQNIQNLVNIPKEQFKIEQKKISPTQSLIQKQNFTNKIINVDKNTAYIEFKNTSGQQLNNSILKNIEDLNQKKTWIKQKTNQVITLKQQIDKTTLELNKKSENKTQQEINQGIIDQQEYDLLKKKKELKKQYKNKAEHLKLVKNQIHDLDQTINNCKQQLLYKFQEWFKTRYKISIRDIENPLVNQKEEDQEEEQFAKEQKGDADALAYISAKKKVGKLQKARKQKY